MTTPQTIPYPHPGEVLKNDFIEPLELTAYKVAKTLGVSQTAIGEILAGKRSISPEMALRLEQYTRISARTWINLQAAYDLDQARHNSKLTKKLKAIRPVALAA